jgi:hypothetical protein
MKAVTALGELITVNLADDCHVELQEKRKQRRLFAGIDDLAYERNLDESQQERRFVANVGRPPKGDRFFLMFNEQRLGNDGCWTCESILAHLLLDEFLLPSPRAELYPQH